MCQSTVTTRAPDVLCLTCLALVSVVAALLRAYNLSWDNGLLFHPDEANLIHATQRLRIPSQLDPDFFAYNGFPIYLYRISTDVLAWLQSTPDWNSQTENMVMVGRTLSAIFSTLSVVAIYFLGRLVADRLVGLWAAIFLAFNVGMIQTAHFAVTENLMVLFLILLAILTIKSTENSINFRRTSWRIGLLLGLALGTKTTALAYFCIPAVAALVGWLREEQPGLHSLRAWFLGGSIALAVAGITFCLVSPYSLLRFDAFRSSMDFEWEVVSGKRDIFYTRQFLGKRDYWYPFVNLHWLCGPLLPGACVIGLVHWLAKLSQRRNSLTVLPFLLFGILYFLYVGHWHAKFIRYTLLTIPGLCLCAAWFVCRWQQKMENVMWRMLPTALVGGSCIVWSAMFFTIYLRPDTRLVASRWLVEHAPQNSHMLYEVGDYPILPQPIAAQSNFSIEGMRVYDPDSDAKVDELARQLATADYLILASPRFYDTIPKTPERFPLTAQYYWGLFNGDLGYHVSATFTSKPTLGVWQVDDNDAEETFSVFDHPNVLILEKFVALTADQIVENIRSIDLNSIHSE